MRFAAVYHKQLGDTLLLQPALGLLAAKSGQPVTLFTHPAHRPLIELMPGVIPGDPAAPGPGFDRIIAFDQSSRSLFRTLRIGARHRQLVARARVYVRWYHKWLFHSCSSGELCDRYVGRYYFDVAANPDGGAAFVPPRLRRPPGAWRDSLDVPSPSVLINPVSAWSEKSWSATGWQTVIRSILDRSDGPVGVLGGKTDWQTALCQDICAPFPKDRVINLAGRTSLKQFLSLLAEAPMTLTVDGAASHVAQAFGNKTVALFGPTKPLLWHHDTPHNLSIHASQFADHPLPPVAEIPPSAVIEAMIRAESGQSPPSLPGD